MSNFDKENWTLLFDRSGSVNIMRKNSITVFGVHKGKDELRWNRADF